MLHRTSRAYRAVAYTLVTAASAAAAVACGAGGDGGTSPAPLLADRILFVSTRDDPGPPPESLIQLQGLYSMRAADGGDVQRLAPGFDRASSAAVSPDGRTLAFSDGVRWEGDGEKLYVGAVGGSQFRRLTTTVDEDEWRPAWSPDGKRIAYGCQAPVGEQPGALCVVNADGSGYRVVHRTPSRYEIVGTVAWSPDGGRIAFDVQRSNSVVYAQIYVVNADGSGLTTLTAGPLDLSPTWSPDGRRIAFARGTSDGVTGCCIGSAIYVMGADGGGVARLTALGNKDQHPAWSPDGARIAFASVRGHETGYPDVYVMRADGSGEANLTNNPDAFDSHPKWAPRR